MPTLADLGYEGAGIGILTPVKRPSGNQEPDIGTRSSAAWWTRTSNQSTPWLEN
jgi:hypothetical protein